MKSAGFTLIELLIVIAIIAILSVVVIFVLNPAELLRQARDSQRLSDLATLSRAIGVVSSEGNGTNSLGSASVDYLSLRDTAATSSVGDQCQGASIPTPGPSTYHCASTTYYTRTNGTGWIPINFNVLGGGSPIGELPVDPTNGFAASSHLLYDYETNGTQYSLGAVMESAKYKMGGSNDVVSTDSGFAASVLEKGTISIRHSDWGDTSLLAYFPFDTPSGNFSPDYSGYSDTSTWGIYSGSWTLGVGGSYTAGQSPNTYSANFTGSNGFGIGGPSFIMGTAMTISLWTQSSNYAGSIPFSIYAPNVSGDFINLYWYNNGSNLSLCWNIGDSNSNCFWTGNPVSFWVNLIITDDPTTNLATLYVDGTNYGTAAYRNSSSNGTSTSVNLGIPAYGSYQYTGQIQDFRIYNRVLSQGEITALANSMD